MSCKLENLGDLKTAPFFKAILQQLSSSLNYPLSKHLRWQIAPLVVKVTWLVGCFSLAGLSNIQWRHKLLDEIFSVSMLYVMKFRIDVGCSECLVTLEWLFIGVDSLYSNEQQSLLLWLKVSIGCGRILKRTGLVEMTNWQSVPDSEPIVLSSNTAVFARCHEATSDARRRHSYCFGGCQKIIE